MNGGREIAENWIAEALVVKRSVVPVMRLTYILISLYFRN